MALMYSFSKLEQVHCSMSGSNCFFLNCTQISQEVGKVVCYSHLLKNFPLFVVIHTVKSFSIVSKEDVYVYLELSCFFYDSTDVGNLISGSCAFSQWTLNIWKFSVHVLLKLSLEKIDYCFVACEMWAIVGQFGHSLALPFFGIRMETEFFLSCGHC